MTAKLNFRYVSDCKRRASFKKKKLNSTQTIRYSLLFPLLRNGIKRNIACKQPNSNTENREGCHGKGRRITGCWKLAMLIKTEGLLMVSLTFNQTLTSNRKRIYTKNNEKKKWKWHQPVAAVARRDAVVAAAAAAFETIAAVDDMLPGDAKMSQSVIFLLDARIGHRGNAGPLLGQAQVVGTSARPAGRFHRLRATVMGAAIPGHRRQSSKTLLWMGARGQEYFCMFHYLIKPCTRPWCIL